MKRSELFESLRAWLPAAPRLAPAGAGAPVLFASSGGSGGGGSFEDPDDEPFYEDEELDDEEPAPRRATERRPTAARQRTVQTDTDDRYWTDYLRIALPVIGLLLVIAVFWYWAQQLIDNDGEELTPTEQPGVAEVVDTTPEATDPPSTPVVDTGVQQAADSTPQNPLQAIPSPTPAQQQPAADTAEQPPAEEQPAEEQAGGIAPDAQVSVIEGPLNMRAEPSTQADIVVALDTGAALTVLSGPEEGEGYTWWQVTDDTGNMGWVVEEFIQPAE